MRLPLWPQGKQLIIDEVGDVVCSCKTKPERDYIVQAINSHEKLVELIRDIDAEACLNRQEWHSEDEHLRGYARLLIDRIEQVLKEAGK